MTSRPALRSAHRALICLVLAALSLAQTLGMVHRVLHGAYGAHPAPGQAVAPAHTERQPSQSLAALFDGHEEGRADCQLFDQISHADLAAAGLPMFEPRSQHGTRPVTRAAWHIAARQVGFQARGPPERA